MSTTEEFEYPNALRLADLLTQPTDINTRFQSMIEAANELRQMHKIIYELVEALEISANQLETDAIFMQMSGANGLHQEKACKKARLAINNAQGQIQ